jgi:competence protein ComEC
VQVLASFGLLPLLLLFFQQGSLSAPLANLVAVPLVGFAVVPLTLLGSALVAFWPEGGGVLLRLAADLFQWFWPGLEMLVGKVPLLSRSVPIWTLAPALLGMAWLLMPRGWPFRSLGAFLLLPMLLVKTAPPAEGTAQFTLLDVGQSLAAVVQTHRHTLVFDTGLRFPSGFDAGKGVLLPFLRQRGIEQVDILLLSHGDNDHIGGARSLSDGIPIKRILTSAPHKVTWARPEPCRSGQSWQWDGVEFSVLHPPDLGRDGRGNDESCVLMVSVGEQRVLLPGDIEAAAERILVAGDAELHAQVLIAPHHGSKTSSTSAFIEAVQPDWVLYPVGYRNRFGFPNPKVSERYRQAGVREIRSDRSGAVSLTLGEGGIQPQSWRLHVRRYWHSRWE